MQRRLLRRRGEGDEGAASLVPDAGGVGVEQVVDAPNEPGPLRRVGQAGLVDQRFGGDL